MTKEVIAMAREAGLFTHKEVQPEIIHFATLVRNAALEEAAQKCVREDAKPKCTECAKWRKEQAENREWIEGVAEGRRIVEKLAAKKQI